MVGLTACLIMVMAAAFLIAKADIWHVSVLSKQLVEMRKVLLWWRRERMPRELRTATVFLSEQNICALSPVPLHGRVDQVFRTAKGTLIPVDTKTRHAFRIYASDIIQLSVYGLILKTEFGTRHPIADYGYVRVVVDAGSIGREQVRYLRVKLMRQNKLIRLWLRHSDLTQRRVSPNCSCNGPLHE